ncbi:hypothetical protein N9W34_07005, partial [Rickettsiales bacterium]|nr:hypothetical protein [Rickettsiales bacterium]
DAQKEAEIKNNIKNIIKNAENEAFGQNSPPSGFKQKAKALFKKGSDKGYGKYLMVGGGVAALAISTAAIVGTGGAAAPLVFLGAAAACSTVSFAGTIMDKDHDSSKFTKDIVIMMRDNNAIKEEAQNNSSLSAQRQQEIIRKCDENHDKLQQDLRQNLEKKFGLKDKDNKNMDKTANGFSKASLACTAFNVVTKGEAVISGVGSVLHAAGAFTGAIGTSLGVVSNGIRKAAHYHEVRSWRPSRNAVALSIRGMSQELGLEPDKKIEKWGKQADAAQIKAQAKEAQSQADLQQVEQSETRSSSIKKKIGIAAGGIGAAAAAAVSISPEIMDSLSVISDFATVGADVAANVAVMGAAGLAMSATMVGVGIANKINERRTQKEEKSWVEKVTSPDITPAIDRSQSDNSMMRIILPLIILFEQLTDFTL